ncbi:MFS transporter [Bifidobacterium sp. ESL0800]|uniref:MFS transporter n=1 Tax=Bifidobacterium sp. ESL0800 TaxID=2983236 RepID=UPI0023F9235C|nr:MFS transporter [Bifidobacterium sp. ESL0800]WEV75829.1 MFS transporter [Bifidobacterium sp. ESL0800]
MAGNKGMEQTRAQKLEAGSKTGGVMLIAALMTGYSVIYMDKNMISTAIIPISSQFHLDTGQTGLIMSMFFLAYSIMQVPCGWLADKFGARRVLMASMVFIAIFSYLFGAVSGLALFIVIRFGAGLGHGGYPPSCSKAIAENFPRKKRTFVQSLILSTNGIGAILAFTLGAHLVVRNWRVAYAVLGSLYLVAFLMIWIFVTDGKREDATEVEKADAVDEVEQVEPGKQTAQVAIAEPEEKPKFTQVIKNRNVIVLFIAMFLVNVISYGNISWLPSYITKTYGMSMGKMGYILAFNAIFTTVATIFSGTLLSKFFLHKERQATVVSALLVAVLIVAFVLSKNLVVSIIMLILLSMICALVFTSIFTWPHKIMDARVIGSVIGIVNTGGTLGGFVAPAAIGYLVKAMGGSFVPAFLFLAGVAVCVAITVLFVKVPEQKKD